jgi:hypothetical protein
MNDQLIELFRMALENGELMYENQRTNITEGLARLEQGKHLTQSQAACWGHYCQRLRKAA